MTFATSYDGDSPSDPYTRGSAVHARRKAFHASTAVAAATDVSQGAYRTTNSITKGA